MLSPFADVEEADTAAPTSPIPALPTTCLRVSDFSGVVICDPLNESA
jgi:hypothetical protein